jgi:hypothetical protein
MEREGNDCDLGGEKSLPTASLVGKESIFNSTLLLDHVGEVILTLYSDGLSWKSLEPLENVCFFSIAFNMFVKIPDLDCEIHMGLCLGGCMLVWSAIFCLSFLVCNLDMFFNLGLVWMNNLISYSLNVYHISADV